jgi:hypothetical protein
MRLAPHVLAWVSDMQQVPVKLYFVAAACCILKSTSARGTYTFVVARPSLQHGAIKMNDLALKLRTRSVMPRCAAFRSSRLAYRDEAILLSRQELGIRSRNPFSTQHLKPDRFTAPPSWMKRVCAIKALQG